MARGTIIVAFALMFDQEKMLKIQELERELLNKEDEYVYALRSHKDYNTLRGIRENITKLKTELYSLYDPPQPNQK